MTQKSQIEEFPTQVVRQLQAAGFVAYWAGGCVRDLLLQRSPKDFDVATNATPEQVRQLFGPKNTHSVGAAFGVILVRGSRGIEPVEVATFREDGPYTDGRRPDSVQFSSAERDAQRRDFTINGIFFDPTTQTTIDYVGGQEDLDRRIVRAIGDPHQRIREDKLRMLRAVRFSSSLGFELDHATERAVAQHAPEVTTVSGERVGHELRKMLVHPNRCRAVELLQRTQLVRYVAPTLADLKSTRDRRSDNEELLHRIDVASLPEPLVFPTVLSAWMYRHQDDNPFENELQDIARRWKLSNSEAETTQWLLASLPTVLSAHTLAWHTVQPVLTAPAAVAAIELARGVAAVHRSDRPEGGKGVVFCEEKLRLSPDVLNPERWVTGGCLTEAGYRPGPAFRDALQQAWEAQLDDRVHSPAEALQLAVDILGEGRPVGGRPEQAG